MEQEAAVNAQERLPFVPVADLNAVQLVIVVT